MSDFDLDGDIDNPDGGFSCEGVPVSGLAAYVDDRDWLEELIDASDPAGCNGDKAHKSTEYDMMRYMWDMMTDGVPFQAIVDIYDDANPRSWNPTHNLGTPANDPENRWRDAALSNGYLSFHNDAKNNGLDH